MVKGVYNNTDSLTAILAPHSW